MKNLTFILSAISFFFVLACFFVFVVWLKAISLNEFLFTVVILGSMGYYCYCFICYPGDFKNGCKRN